MPSQILIVDDEKNIAFVIQAMLERAGFSTQTFTDSTAAMRALDEGHFDVVVTDLYMPNHDGMEVLSHAHQVDASLPVVMITAFGTVEAAVAALKKGAFDFITKPFDQTELLNVIGKAVQTRQRAESEPTGSSQTQTPHLSTMIGESPQMQELFKRMIKIAPSPATVMIYGESGTGKELVAQEIHRLSDRAFKPFIKINCAAIPATLIESELFGYERGAFTGAATSKPGRFELAHGGTLFLDEVAEMPLEMQVKLLRVIQEQEFERVGGVQTHHVDVRIITATNRDLDEEVKAGRFREDLFYRLNVVPLTLAPLRERQQDIDLLVQFFIKRFNAKLKVQIEGVEPRCAQVLRTYSWPGNIRQLENVMERMMLMTDGSRLQIRDLPPELLSACGMKEAEDSSSEEGASFKEIVRRQTQSLERGLIEKALQETGGNITRAAEKLGLSRKGLQIKMKELGFKRPVDDQP